MTYPQSQQRYLIDMMMHNRKKSSMHGNKLRISNCAEKSPPSKYRMKSPILYCDKDGTFKAMIPSNTYLFRAYILSPNTSNKKFNTKFRGRFCMLHAEFIWLLSKTMTHHIFK